MWVYALFARKNRARLPITSLRNGAEERISPWIQQLQVLEGWKCRPYRYPWSSGFLFDVIGQSCEVIKPVFPDAALPFEPALDFHQRSGLNVAGPHATFLD